MARFLFFAVVAIVTNTVYGASTKGFANANDQRYYVVIDVLRGDPSTGEREGREIGTVEEKVQESMGPTFTLEDTYVPLVAEYLSRPLEELGRAQTTTLSIDKETGSIASMAGDSLIGYYINFLRGKGKEGDFTVPNLPTMGSNSQLTYAGNLYVLVSNEEILPGAEGYEFHRFSWREKSPTTTTLKGWLPESIGSRLEENRYRHGKLLFLCNELGNDVEYLGGIYYMEDVRSALANITIAKEFLSRREGYTRGVEESVKGFLNVLPGVTSAHKGTARITIIREDAAKSMGAMEYMGFEESIQYTIRTLIGTSEHEEGEGKEE